MIYPKDFEKKIGFEAIRNSLLEYCASHLGKVEVANMAFSSNYEIVLKKLGEVSEMIAIKKSDLPYPTPPSSDIIKYLSEIRAVNSYLSADKLYKILLMLQSFDGLRKFFFDIAIDNGDTPSPMFPILADNVKNLTGFPSICNEISKAINKFGEIKDNASPELYEIRQAIRSASGSMQRAMKRVMDNAISTGIIDNDASPSIRDGRMVIPIPAGKKRSISGIIHDESATGKTVFIEPAEVVEAGNRLRELHLKEKREEAVILIALADQIRPYLDEIVANCKIVGYLDFVSSKAAFAIDVNAEMPHIENHPEIEWYNAVHPGLYLSLRNQGRQVVPLDITLSKEKRILIISGPNAGGKSVCLKTVAFVQYMMQCGLMPTLYANSHMGIFKKILIDIGDEQSLENDLSTYSSHLKNMRFFLQQASDKTLVLADEMGSGTEPQIGGALAQAILEQLGKDGCYGVITTHYHNLKTFAETTPGFVNGAMLYDRAHLQPTFQLSVGNPGSSFAIDIAHKMGLPKEVIEEAKRIVGEDYTNLDKYLSDIARDKKYWANKRQNIREKENRLDNLLSKYEEVSGDLKAQRREILNDARKEAKEILSEANAKIERTILEIRKIQAEKEKTKQLRKELAEYKDAVNDDAKSDYKIPDKLKPLKHKSKSKPVEKKNNPPAKTRPIGVDDYVKMDGANSVGKVLSISGKKAVVAFGALRTIVELNRLSLTQPPKQSALSATSAISRSTEEASRQRQLKFKNEIDVRGMRADEAIQAVTYFIDDAIQFNAQKVRILHGTGHGILKTMIRQQLKSIPAVSHFEDEDIRFGGAGITVVEFD